VNITTPPATGHRNVAPAVGAFVVRPVRDRLRQSDAERAWRIVVLLHKFPARRAGVAAELGLSAGAVYAARSCVPNRLR